MLRIPLIFFFTLRQLQNQRPVFTGESTMTAKILIIDDDASLLKALTYNLEQEGYRLITARNGREAMQKLYAERPDLLILDIMMPELDGWQVCKRVREMSDVPIIMLTARETSEDIIKGLDLGADDYIVKPFTVKEVLARVRAALRRTPQQDSRDEQQVYQDIYLMVDLGTQTVTANGTVVPLTSTEYRVLALLVANRGRVLSFQEILEQIWGAEYLDEIGYVHTYIWRLRRKIEPEPKNPHYLVGYPGVGYRFAPA